MELLLPLTQWRPTLRLGMQGLDVQAWQRVLIDEGYDVGKSGADQIFGTLVHNATVAWQRARGWRGVEVTGEVGALERSALESGLEPSEATTPSAQWSSASIKYVEAKNWSRLVGRQPKKWIVLHSMEMAEASTTAERCAAFFAMQTEHTKACLPGCGHTSAHACIDDDSIVQCVPWDRIAWHAPGANQLGIGLEHAGFARFELSQWRDAYCQRMLAKSAWLAAWLSKQFTIPLISVDAAGLLAGDAGVTTHFTVNQAFHGSNHTDPGLAFPLADYLDLARRLRLTDPSLR